jgi:hypothetical protein
LIAVPNTPVKNLFWLPGVVDAIAGGSASELQCRQFFSSTIDADSGGLGACQLAEGLGQSFATLLSIETPLCFLRNLPTAQNLSSGGLQLVQGKFPSGGITKLFAPGETKARTVQINTSPIGGRGGTEKIFVRIASQPQNTKKKLLYSADLYFCPPGIPLPRGYNNVRINDAGKLKLTIANLSDPFRGGENSLNVEGFLTFQNKGVVWDPSRNRTVLVQENRSTGNFKASFVITAGNLILQKVRNSFEGRTSKSYSISRFSGSDFSTVALREGVFTGFDLTLSNFRNLEGTAEFRDSYYAASPSNSLFTRVDNFDISGDEFFDDIAMPGVDITAYSCNTTPDIEVTLVQENATIQQNLGICNRTEFDNITFCRNDPTVQAAFANYTTACPMFPPQNGSPGDSGPGMGG